MIVRLTLDEILSLFPSASIEGSTTVSQIAGISALDSAKEEDLSFLGNPKYKGLVASCSACLIILPVDYVGKPNANQLYLRVEDPSRCLAQVCGLLEKQISPDPLPGVHPSAFIEEGAAISEGVAIGPFSFVAENAVVGENTIIGSHCHVGAHVEVGKFCKIHPGVKILSRCRIEDGVVLNSGVVIGSEGFGFEQVGQSHEKIPHLGCVVIEENVEIGANTCIDRARFEETRIGAGTKIDNLVQIGHNVRIGKGCLIVAQVGISGSVTFEDNVVVGGQAGFAGHLKVGKGAKIAGQSGITKDVEAGAFLKGNPALPYQLAQRISVLQRKLPDLFNRFAESADKK